MNTKKYILNIIISIFLFNTVISISNASTQGVIERYELLTGDKVLVSDVMNEHKAEIGINGNTLVNMFNGFLSLTNNDNVYTIYEYNKAILQAQSGFIGNIAPNYLGTLNLLKNMVQNYTYTLYFNCNIEGARFGIIGIDSNGNEVGSQYSILTKKGDNKFVFTLDSNISSVKEFRFKLFDTLSNEIHIFSDIVLLEGNYDYDSLSYFEGLLSSGELLNNKITVTNKALSDADRFIDSINLVLKEPLRGLKNGIRDKIVEIDGELFIERNTKKIIINGDSKFNYYYRSGSPIAKFHIKSKSTDDTKKGKASMEIECDIFPTSTETYTRRTHASLAIHPDTSSTFSGSIDVSLLKTQDTSGLQKYFEENPATVVYAISTPKYEPLNYLNTNMKLSLFEGNNLLYSDSVVPPNISISVDRLLNISERLVQEAKNNPTFENLSQARYWINLIDDSIFKDSLQEEINNISNVIDVEIERKSISTNMDVYIKSSNSLSVALSTNSVVFDNYTGASDIENINALEFTIHSSLPYDLSVCLENDIQNSDKSVIIDSSLLQIKENSDTVYKSFTNTGDKIILKESNPYGNYNKHSIDLKMKGSNAYKADIYKTTIKLEVEQK